MGERTPHTAFGKRLRAELAAQQVSVRELARRMNSSDPEGTRRTIARWLTPNADAVRPSRASVRAAAAALGVDPSMLMVEDDADVPLSRDDAERLIAMLSRALGVA